MSLSSAPPDTLHKHVTQLDAWALSIGASIGWGSFVITSNTYLSGAGPLGSALGMLTGALVMLVIGANYHYLMGGFRDAGGVYVYARQVLSHGNGFLVAWFLALTYLAMLWANATSIPLFTRYFIGDVFCVGRLYALFGYEVWFGEAMISVLAILLVGLLCIRLPRLSLRLNAALALLFTLGIGVCFAAALLGGGVSERMEPLFVPDSAPLSQVVKIAFISPWAFIGFENISHAAEEFRFPVRRSFRVLSLSVAVTTLLYIAVTLLSVTAYPPQYESWLAYIRDLGSLSGLEGLPAFYAARHYLGQGGVLLLMFSLLALILTSLIANTFALSRLFCALARDGLLPAPLARVNRGGAPRNAILAVVLLSLAIPFLGRTCIGWIVDVTTVGATLVYGFVSAAALRKARQDEYRLGTLLGGAGLALMLLFGAALLLPNLLFSFSMDSASYFIFIIWSVIGLFYFRHISRRDASRRFENAINVWVVLLVMIVFMSIVWMSEVYENATMEMVLSIRGYYSGEAEQSLSVLMENPYVASAINRFHGMILHVSLVVLGLFGLSIMAMLWNYHNIRRASQEARRELGSARVLAYTDSLTGVKSKHAYSEMEARMDGRIQQGGVESFGLVICDLNGTKTINDTRGHLAGDEYIRAGCKLICKVFKHSPVFRIGGDEFAVLLEGQDFQNRQELLRSVDAEMERDGVVVALGLAEYRSGEDSCFHKVFERADSEMYRNKKSLKDRNGR